MDQLLKRIPLWSYNNSWLREGIGGKGLGGTGRLGSLMAPQEYGLSGCPRTGPEGGGPAWYTRGQVSYA